MTRIFVGIALTPLWIFAALIWLVVAPFALVYEARWDRGMETWKNFFWW